MHYLTEDSSTHDLNSRAAATLREKARINNDPGKEKQKSVFERHENGDAWCAIIARS